VRHNAYLLERLQRCLKKIGRERKKKQEGSSKRNFGQSFYLFLASLRDLSLSQ
jgi:hypothetical protein